MMPLSNQPSVSLPSMGLRLVWVGFALVFSLGCDLVPHSEQGAQGRGSGCVAPMATGRIDLSVNLDPTDPLAVSGFDAANPRDAARYGLTVDFCEADGQAASFKLYFTRDADLTWGWHVVGDGAVAHSGVLTFDSAGLLATQSGTSFVFESADGAGTELELCFGTPGSQLSDTSTAWAMGSTVVQAHISGCGEPQCSRPPACEGGR